MCFMNDNDNIIVECSINVNITIAINYFVNINLYGSRHVCLQNATKICRLTAAYSV